MYIPYNPNPFASRAGDCVVRAVARATDKNWIETYIDLCIEGLLMGEMPSSNAVWGKYLRDHGFKQYIIPEYQDLKSFLSDHNSGTYVIGTGKHAVCCIDGNHFDSWDSSDEIPIYFWKKEEK